MSILRTFRRLPHIPNNCPKDHHPKAISTNQPATHPHTFQPQPKPSPSSRTPPSNANPKSPKDTTRSLHPQRHQRPLPHTQRTPTRLPNRRRTVRLRRREVVQQLNQHVQTSPISHRKHPTPPPPLRRHSGANPILLIYKQRRRRPHLCQGRTIRR